MSETSFWNYLRKIMHGRWDATRIETSTTVGVADVSFGLSGINGWIELKEVEDWPKRVSTNIKIKHMTIFQQKWLEKRQQFGGHCWLFTRITRPREYLLHEVFNYKFLMEGQPKPYWRFSAFKIWNGRIDPEELWRILSEES